ncbi:hypothetical protein [Pseudodesulfovibrio indicus]|uniref:hypothetical protein n=1 Tax=Pseudodesulfovibrio indicus TaxID=1716143 RepID=UPI00292F6818|nr:hypothetical protein [Pseudodesulfovibrio indicus]
MPDISISTDTVQTMSMDSLFSAPDSIKDVSDIIGSGENSHAADQREMAVAGAEVASRTEDFFGAGTDFSSTGTDYDVQQTVHQAVVDTGLGSITDKIV